MFITRNDDCYTAPWINLNKILGKAEKDGFIKRNEITKEDKAIITNVNITLSEFEYIINKYSTYPIEDFFTDYTKDRGYFDIPLDDKYNGTMIFDLNGYAEII